MNRALCLVAGMLAATACARPPAELFRLPPRRPPVLERAQGVVFDDRNGNGVREAGEPGLPGVLVSNGTDLVPTDADGRYDLLISDDSILFVIKPRDWMTPVDPNGLPQFYYVHKPEGSPDDGFRYPGVPPTGPLPASVDFPLQRRPEPDRFQVIVLADPQPYTSEELAYFARDTIAELVGSEAAFGMSLGDLVGDDLSLFEPLNAVQGLVGIPWYNVLGNHDMNYEAFYDEHSDESFERVYGPATYAFAYGPVHFVVLDDVVWDRTAGRRGRDGAPKGLYRRGLRDDQLVFVRRYLETVPPDRLVVLAMHVPMGGGGKRPFAGLEPLLAILSTHPHTFSMSGHSHRQRYFFFGAEDGYAPPGGGEHVHLNAVTASGSWYGGAADELGLPHATMRDGAPNGYSIVSFDGNAYAVRYKASRWPADYQMTIHAPDRIARGDASRTEVVVNVFAGSERSVVEMRLGPASPWTPMQPVERVDPLYLELLARERDVAGDTNLPDATPSTHLWSAYLPKRPAPGAHWIEVRSTDLFGHTDVAVRPIRID
ncbi:MAG: calcineurin-like phosphoesterase family protein [Deltaproteobacteria bacterium]|nr:MAG: calcineurin-like phosphoesterase family protein [Deltaproteobacteria bacterium]